MKFHIRCTNECPPNSLYFPTSPNAVAEDLFLQQSNETFKIQKTLAKEKDDNRKLVDENKNLQRELQSQKEKAALDGSVYMVRLKEAHDKIQELQSLIERNNKHKKVVTTVLIDENARNDTIVHDENSNNNNNNNRKKQLPPTNTVSKPQHPQEHQQPIQTRHQKKRKSSEFNMSNTLNIMFGMPATSR